MSRTWLVWLVLTGAPAACLAAEQKAPVPPQFTDLVARTQATWNVPGISVAVVQDGKVAYSQGFGLREIRRAEKVDADTIFGLASITKLLITGAIAVLVDEGKVTLDAPLIEALPDFRVADPYVTRNVTVRDLLSHRSGIDFAGRSGGLGEQVEEWDSSEFVRRAHLLPQQFSLRAKYQYNDFGYLVLAELITQVSGQPWYQFIRQRVAEPLGMKQTWARSWDFLPRTHVLPTGNGWSESIPRGLATLPPQINIAVPHTMWARMQPQIAYDDRELKRTTVHFHRSPIDPCQSGWSSARDLASYAAMWLSDGRHGDAAFVRPEVVRQLQEWTATADPSWPLHRNPAFDERTLPVWDHHIGQASGFAVYDYAGHLQFGHDGYELGYSSVFRMDRARGIAVAVLVNNSLYEEGGLAASVIAGAILDWHYGLPSPERNALFFASFRKNSERAVKEYQAERAKEEASRDPKAKATLPPSAYVGRYEDELVGPLHITLRKGRLVASTHPTASWILQPWSGDVFEGIWQGAMSGRQRFSFQIGADSRVESVSLVGTSLIYQRVH